jgi:hypothetical protein
MPEDWAGGLKGHHPFAFRLGNGALHLRKEQSVTAISLTINLSYSVKTAWNHESCLHQPRDFS